MCPTQIRCQGTVEIESDLILLQQWATTTVIAAAVAAAAPREMAAGTRVDLERRLEPLDAGMSADLVSSSQLGRLRFASTICP